MGNCNVSALIPARKSSNGVQSPRFFRRPGEKMEQESSGAAEQVKEKAEGADRL
jgi:hypothetical protein